MPKENAMACVGVNIGALTVKVVALRGDDRIARVVPHLGRPLEVLKEILAGNEFAAAGFFGVSGHLGHLTEVAAIQRALRELNGDYDATVSLGGESFLVYLLTDGRITNVLSHNKCAAGSGEFFGRERGFLKSFWHGWRSGVSAERRYFEFGQRRSADAPNFIKK